jgi:sterol desaturase/sphingolipid hydroxylase (fatty acid hydroxylase superfamily)
LRHAKEWWLAFHQIHHSPSRIELLTSFYKHPIEILCDAVLSAVILYPLMGCYLAHFGTVSLDLGNGVVLSIARG